MKKYGEEFNKMCLIAAGLPLHDKGKEKDSTATFFISIFK
jgi:hypothetical protein